MTISLVRVDDRLIHGQVVVGWGQALSPQRFVLVDDEIAADEWEAELYRAGVPDDVAVEFATIDEAGRRFDWWMRSKERTILLVKDVDGLLRLCAETSSITDINLGGLHQDGGRIQRLPYVFLNEDEMTKLKALERRGIAITAQDLPNARPVPLGELT